MTYLRAFFLNFLFVFFINRVAPGIDVTYFEEVPNVGADLVFSIAVGFLNASIFPFLAILEIPISYLKLAIFAAVVSFGAFAAIAMVPFGVEASGAGAVVFAGAWVWAMAFFSNVLEWRYTTRR